MVVWGKEDYYINCFVQQRVGRSTGDKEDKPMGAQAHQRMVTTLQKQIAAKQKEKEEVCELWIGGIIYKS